MDVEVVVEVIEVVVWEEALLDSVSNNWRIFKDGIVTSSPFPSLIVALSFVWVPARF